jgi:hypothetical protein
MFIPQFIILNEDGFIIKFFLRKRHYILFHDINAYGKVGFTFCIQPNVGSTLQIYAGCFSTKKWRTFIGLIKTKCLGKKAWFWIGPWAIR